MTLHPTTVLIFWGAAAAVVQILDPYCLSGLSVAILIGVLYFARDRFRQLLRRSRWLMFSLFLIFSFATPGVLLIPHFGVLSPTEEGVWLATYHLLRLTDILAMLAILLAYLPIQELVSGLYGLLKPTRLFGARPERVALRIALVIHLLESAPPKAVWRDWIDGETRAQKPFSDTPGGAASPVKLMERTYSRLDFALWAVLLLVSLIYMGTML